MTILDGYDFDEVKEHVQLSANNHAKSESLLERLYQLLLWAVKETIDDLEEIKTWINRLSIMEVEEVDKIAIYLSRI